MLLFKLTDGVTEEIIIKRGVRQEGVISLLLFNVYSEMIFKQALDEAAAGITISGIIINNLRNADISVLTAGTEIDLQTPFDSVYEISRTFGTRHGP